MGPLNQANGLEGATQSSQGKIAEVHEDPEDEPKEINKDPY